MDEPSNGSGKLEKVNHVIRIFLAVATVGILLVVLYVVLTRGTGY